MTPEQYEERNSKGFEGDPYLKELVNQICIDNNIDIIIETGSYHGWTAKQLSYMANQVITVEVDEQNYHTTCKNLEGSGVECCFGNSVDALRYDILPRIDKTKNILWYCDSHWQQYNPLLDEFKVFKEFGITPITIIHDFKVPNHPEFGFDVYGDIVYEWDWVEEGVNDMYGEGQYTHYYNEFAEGAMRGVVIIEPLSMEKTVFLDNIVSCIMLTKNKEFYKFAIQNFLSQTYKQRELIIIADNEEIFNEVNNYLTKDESMFAGENIVIKLSNSGTIGGMRNEALEIAKGEFVCTWDDDDIRSVEYIETMIKPILDSNADLCVSSQVIMTNTLTREKKVAYSENEGFGNVAIWRNNNLRYGLLNKGEDTKFLNKLVGRGFVKVLIDNKPELYNYIFHGSNISGIDHWNFLFSNSDKKIE